MINWELIAERLAEAAQGDLRVSADTIGLRAQFLFHMQVNSHLTNPAIGDTFRAAYNFVMTLANREGLTEKDKLNVLSQFATHLCVSQDYVIELLKEAGYIPPVVPNTTDLQHFRARNFHPDIVAHCEQVFLQGHYFVAVAEASKAYNIAVKKKLGGVAKDGTQLMLAEFGLDKRIRAVPGNRESERNFLEGIKFLSAGLIQGFRNPTSHETMQTWEIDEQDCLDILSLASYLFRQLDKAIIQP